MSKTNAYDKYIGRPFSVEIYQYSLKHSDKNYKYIRKEMINGKMRYYYEDDIRGHKQTLRDDELISDHGGSGGTFGDGYKPNAKIDDTKIEKIKDLPKKASNLSITEDQNRVNPDYDKTEAEYSMNCAYCSATMDLRLRGYDVEARPYLDDYDANVYTESKWYKNTDTKDWVYVGYDIDQKIKDLKASKNDPLYRPSDELKAYYEDRIDEEFTDVSEKYNSLTSRISRLLSGQKDIDVSTPEGQFEALKAMMLEHGEGSYGLFSLNWNTGSAHSVFWSVENDEIIIRDTQVNTACTIDEYFKKYDKYIDYYGYLRTDNREISDEILKTCRKRRGLS